MDSKIAIVTKININNTPIKEFLKNKVSKKMLKDWKKWPSVINKKVYKNKEFHEKHIAFYKLVNELAIEISKNKNFERAEGIKPLDKYETCVISGLRATGKIGAK